MRECGTACSYSCCVQGFCGAHSRSSLTSALAMILSFHFVPEGDIRTYFRATVRSGRLFRFLGAVFLVYGSVSPAVLMETGMHKCAQPSRTDMGVSHQTPIGLDGWRRSKLQESSWPIDRQEYHEGKR